MNPIINLNMNIEKELTMEDQGYRRTRRWIGDAQVSDTRWYQRKSPSTSATYQNQDESKQLTNDRNPQKGLNTLLSQFFSLPSTRRQSASSES
jgi:hypothetical protein